jgi:hypothetical protein
MLNQRIKFWRITAWLLAGLGALGLLALLGALTLAFQSAPWPHLALNPDAPHRPPAIQRLIDRATIQPLLAGQPIRLELPAAELSPFTDDLAARVLKGGGRADLSVPGQATIDLSASVPSTPLRKLAMWGNWLNLHATVQQRRTGPPAVVALQVGRLPVPPRLAWWVLEKVAAHFELGDALTTGLLAVQQVRISPQGISANLHWSDALKARTLASLIPKEDRARMDAYQKELTRVVYAAVPVAPAQGLQPFPLLSLIHPVFGLAQQRSLANAVLAIDADASREVAARENRAALMVLTLYTMRLTMGELLPGEAHPASPSATEVLLQGRNDFAQHFLVSALLASGAGGRLANIVGIYKELSDSDGGSGFSFNDIAADQAGVRFGQRAQHDPVTLQARAVEGEDDGFFMPSVANLPEFLTPAELQKRYGGVGGPGYKRLMDGIEQSVSKLGILR